MQRSVYKPGKVELMEQQLTIEMIAD
ncbi:N-acetyltransferase, partial [Acinetobacter baumannii]|nr:N-acetyltransferase [Acinetobacter baumannii]